MPSKNSATVYILNNNSMKKEQKQFFEVVYNIFNESIARLDHPSHRWENIHLVKRMITVQQQLKDDYLSNPL